MSEFPQQLDPETRRWLKIEVGWRRKNSNRNERDALPGLPSATQGERIDQPLLRGSERDLELEGDTRQRVDRVVPGLGGDA